MSSKKPEELPWDLFDRCLLPIIFSHALAVIISTVLNALKVSQISCFALFVSFLLISIGVTIFYHNLHVSAAGKGVLITDCDNIVGYSLATQLDDLGFTVYAGFPNKTDGLKLKEISSGRLHIVQLNLTSADDINNLSDYIKENLPIDAPGLWAIVNNTTWAAFGEFEWLPMQVYEKAVQINFLSAVKIAQILLPSLRKTQGRIINVSSIAGRLPTAMHSPLCIVKSAMETFSECIRKELKRWGIDVVIVEPGSYTTGLWFNDKKILEDARHMWKNMSEDIQNDYGESYFEYKIRSLPEYQKQPKDPNVSVVVRSITDAINRTFPLSRYTPVTRQEKLQVFIAEHFPPCIYHIFYP